MPDGRTALFDKDAYRRDVLEPIRASATPPADLFARYGLDESRRLSQEEFGEHLAAVTKYWRALKQQKRSYARLIGALVVAHQELERARKLNWDAFAEEHRRVTSMAAERLARQVTDLAAFTDYVGRATLVHLAAGGAAEARVRELLGAHGIGVVEEAWALPARPPIAAYRALRANLDLLGLRLSVDAVFGERTVRAGFRLRGGFRLGTAPSGQGGRLTAEVVEQKVQESVGRARDDSKTALDGILATLAEAARAPGRLDELVLWEVSEALRLRVSAGFQGRAVAAEAVELGLARDEAGALALAVAGAAPAGPAAELARALDEGRLRAAERLAASVPPDEEPELRARVAEASRQAAELLDRAAAEQSAGRPEAAAELLAAVVRLAADDQDAEGRLRALPPPPARQVRTAVSEHRDRRAGTESASVTVAWTPGPARVGPVLYRVVRTTGRAAAAAADGTLIAETDANEAVDAAPPVGADLVYSVFATRAEDVWSAPASGPGVQVLPEVAEVTVAATGRRVTASWRPHPRAVATEVTRLDERDREQAVASGVEGFADDAVTLGRTYRYRVQAVYDRPDGTRARSAGIAVTVRPEQPPEAVRDLAAEPVAGPRPAALVSWTPPASGRVAIRAAAVPPPWEAGAELDPGEVARYGREVPGDATPCGGGRVALTVPINGTTAHYAAVSLGAGRALAGTSTSLRTVAPVRELSGRRLGDAVTLSWIWPDGAHLVRAAWGPPDGGDSEPAADETTVVECTRRAYDDDGGLRIVVGPGTVGISVRAVSRDQDAEAVSAPARCVVDGARPTVRYEFRRPRMPMRRAGTALLVITAERPCRLPALVVVHHTGPALPLRADQGQVIHRVPPSDLGPAAGPLTVRVPVPRTSGRSWLACFTEGDGAGSVTLTRLPGTW